MAIEQHVPSFAYSLYERPDGQGTLAYKVLGKKSNSSNPATLPLVLIHGLSSVGLIDWSPLVEKLSESRQGKASNALFTLYLAVLRLKFN